MAPQAFVNFCSRYFLQFAWVQGIDVIERNGAYILQNFKQTHQTIHSY